MKDLTLSSATRLAASGSRYIDVLGMLWHEPFPGIRMKVLYKDSQSKETLMLFETGPGTVIPEHVRGGVEWVEGLGLVTLGPLNLCARARGGVGIAEGVRVMKTDESSAKRKIKAKLWMT